MWHLPKISEKMLPELGPTGSMIIIIICGWLSEGNADVLWGRKSMKLPGRTNCYHQVFARRRREYQGECMHIIRAAIMHVIRTHAKPCPSCLIKNHGRALKYSRLAEREHWKWQGFKEVYYQMQLIKETSWGWAVPSSVEVKLSSTLA